MYQKDGCKHGLVDFLFCTSCYIEQHGELEPFDVWSKRVCKEAKAMNIKDVEEAMSRGENVQLRPDGSVARGDPGNETFNLWILTDSETVTHSLARQGSALDYCDRKHPGSKLKATFEIPDYDGDTEKQLNHANLIKKAVLWPYELTEAPKKREVPEHCTKCETCAGDGVLKSGHSCEDCAGKGFYHTACGTPVDFCTCSG